MRHCRSLNTHFITLLTLTLAAVSIPFHLSVSLASVQPSTNSSTIAIVAVADHDGNPVINTEGIAEILIHKPPRAEPGQAPLSQEAMPLTFLGNPIYLPARTELEITSSDLYVKLRLSDGSEYIVKGKAVIQLDPDDPTGHIVLRQGTVHTRSNKATAIRTGPVVLGSRSTRYVVLVESEVDPPTVKCHALEGAVTIALLDHSEAYSESLELDAPRTATLTATFDSGINTLYYSRILADDEQMSMRGFFAADRAESVSRSYPVDALEIIMTSYSEHMLNAPSLDSVASELKNFARIPQIRWSLKHGLQQEAQYHFLEASKPFASQYNRIAAFVDENTSFFHVSYPNVEWADVRSPEHWLDLTTQVISTIDERLSPVETHFSAVQTNSAASLLELSIWYETVGKVSLADFYRRAAVESNPLVPDLENSRRPNDATAIIDGSHTVIPLVPDMNQNVWPSYYEQHMRKGM